MSDLAGKQVKSLNAQKSSWKLALKYVSGNVIGSIIHIHKNEKYSQKRTNVLRTQ